MIIKFAHDLTSLTFPSKITLIIIKPTKPFSKLLSIVLDLIKNSFSHSNYPTEMSQFIIICHHLFNFNLPNQKPARRCIHVSSLLCIILQYLFQLNFTLNVAEFSLITIKEKRKYLEKTHAKCLYSKDVETEAKTRGGNYSENDEF